MPTVNNHGHCWYQVNRLLVALQPTTASHLCHSSSPIGESKNNSHGESNLGCAHLILCGVSDTGFWGAPRRGVPSHSTATR
jgi:hypothetical protein